MKREEALTRHVTHTTARVASLLAKATSTATTLVAATVAAATVTTSAAVVAVAGNVANLAALNSKLDGGQHNVGIRLD